jgi:hypothetical protein
MRCWHKKLYYVRTAWKTFADGEGRNFLVTPSLARAMRMNKKLKIAARQIDVRERGKKPYVLKGSWL